MSGSSLPGHEARDLCATLDDVRAPARPSQPGGRRVVIVGGGTFGAILAAELYRRAERELRQVIVLEDGPMLFSDHVQNLPTPGLHVPPPTVRGLDLYETQGQPRHEVWHLPWQSSIPFAGLVRCVGGRSLYWGAFSPEPCPAELAASCPGMDWPPAAVTALQRRYLRRAGHLLGLDRLHAHYLGPLATAVTSGLHSAIRDGRLGQATPLSEIPDHPALAADVQACGRPGGTACPAAAGWDRDLLKLQLPMALEVAGPSTHPVLRRFSSVPTLARALADAHGSAVPGCAARLAVVPSCHVTELIPGDGAITGLRTAQGQLLLEPGDAVVLAAGTIESTRLALLSSRNPRIGTNLASHLRSNLVVRLSRGTLGVPPQARLGAASVLVRCRIRTPSGPWTHFHHQVTAFGLSDGLDPGAELALFHMSPRPDAEQLTTLHAETAGYVVVCVSSVAQMQACNPLSYVRLTTEPDEYGMPRAFAALEPSAQDGRTWEAMDASADELVLALAAGQHYEVLGPDGFTTVPAGQPPSAASAPALRREPLGTGHHELGTLWMGTSPGSSVTTPNCRLRGTANLYAAGPAVFPALGSSSPVLPAMALTLRLADHLTGHPAPDANP